MKLLTTTFIACIFTMQLYAQSMSELLPEELQLQYTFPASMGSSNDWYIANLDEPTIGRSLAIGEFRFDGVNNLAIDLPEALYIRSFDDLGYRIGMGTNTPNATLDVIGDDPSIPVISSVHAYPQGGNADIPAVFGQNTVDDGWGIGVQGDGAFYGVLGTTPSVQGLAGFFQGDVTVTGTFTNPSDAKLKTDIISIAITGKKSGISTLEKIAQLSPKSYVYAEKYKKIMNLPSSKQNGFVAQELQAIFPELVKKNIYRRSSNKDAQVEFLGVNYLGLIPILTAGIQELSQENDELKQRLASLENQLSQILLKLK